MTTTSKPKIVRFPHDCEIERTDPFVVKVKVPLETTNSVFYLGAVGDNHFDHPGNDWRVEKSHLDLFQAAGAGIVNIGDLFCAMQSKGDPRHSKEELPAELKVKDYIGALKRMAERRYSPYAENFLALLMGNHEGKFLDHREINLTEEFADKMRAHGSKMESFGYSAYVILQFIVHNTKRDSVVIHLSHGQGKSAGVSGGTQHNPKRMVSHVADIHISGHLHQFHHRVIPQERPTMAGKIRTRQCDHIQVTSYNSRACELGNGYEASKGIIKSDPRMAMIAFRPTVNGGRSRYGGGLVSWDVFELKEHASPAHFGIF